MRAGEPPDADPAILARVGDVSRPRDALAPTPIPAALPGERGVIAGIANVVGWSRRGNAHLIEQVRRYGPVYRTMVGPQPVVCVTDPELVSLIARNDDRAWSAALAYRAMFDGLMETGTPLDAPAAIDFEPHRDVRRLLAAAFTPTAIDGYLSLVQPLFTRAVDDWLKKGRGSFKREVRRLFAIAAIRLFIGIDDPDEAATFDRATEEVHRTPMLVWRNRHLGPGMRRAVRASRFLADTLLRLIPERRASDKVDLFSRLCREANQVAWIDDATLVRVFIGLMTGAFDTTSAGVTSMAYLLARHPAWQERLREECREVDASHLAREDVNQLEQVEWVWKESLRLYPVSLALPRCTLRDVVLGRYRLPAGTTVLAMTGPVMQDPCFWTAPGTFDPERFSASRAEDRRQRGIYQPFGAGAHACVGMVLAALEAKTFFHAVLSRCRLRLASHGQVHHGFVPLGVVSGPVELYVDPVS